MSIGYACLTVGVLDAQLKTCSLKNAQPETLINLIALNLNALEKMIDYNKQNGVRLFRISSDIIPFGSHSVNTIEWWKLFEAQLKKIGEKAQTADMRLSMHPGQYTVLNSPDCSVVERAVKDLKYHARFLHALGLGNEHKIVLHIGGIYGDKNGAIRRFIEQYRRLDSDIQKRIVIENDDRQYSISDVLALGNAEAIPVVFDTLHHEVNPSGEYSDTEWIEACGSTWKTSDGHQKIHYSQQNPHKRSGSHSETINLSEFLNVYRRLPQRNIDIMLEVKDKNLSAIKCINATESPKIQRLENEWARYKYLILEHSPNVYQAIRELLKDKSAYPVEEFYRLIDESLKREANPGNALNAAQHVWGYFKNSSDEYSQQKSEKLLAKLAKGGSSLPIKRFLLQLAKAQNQSYLLDSLYFKDVLN